MLKRALAGLIMAIATVVSCTPAAGQALADSRLYLEVTLNGHATGMVLQFAQGPGGLRSSVQNLRELGLDPAIFGIAADAAADIDLAAVPNLLHRYDAAAQTVSLEVDYSVREPIRISARKQREVVDAEQVSRGVLLNYQLHSQLGAAGRTAAFHEARWFDAHGIVSTTGTTTLRGFGSAYTRFDTYWTRSNPLTLETVQLGDLITNSLASTRSLRMAGFQWRKNFALRSDLLTYPVPSVRGSALVPTAVSVYVNGMQQLSTEVPAGPYVINQIAGVTGAGQANIVTRDALGRSVTTTLPLYIDTRMMAAGLTDFSVEAGFLRRDYGTRSFRYARSPAVSASMRYGWSDSVTLEGHAEGGRDLVNGGFGWFWKTARSGVISGAVSASAGLNQGIQKSIGYQYISSRFSLDAHSTRASGGFADLASAGGAAPPLLYERGSLNVSLPDAHNASLSYVAYKTSHQPLSRMATLAYSVPLLTRAQMSVSVWRDVDKPSARGISLSISSALGQRMAASGNAGRQGTAASQNFALTKAPEYGGGIGWAAQQGRAHGSRYEQGQMQYLGNAGQMTLLAQRSDGGHAVALDASGALVLMDGNVSPARQVGDGFALVSTGVPGIQIVHENRMLGRTDEKGYLLVSNLVPYTPNLIAVDTSELPVDARIATASHSVVPQHMAGVLVRFPVERYAAATVVIHDVSGKPVSAGSRVVDASTGNSTVVGYDGMAFVEKLLAKNRLIVGDGPARCEVSFSWEQSRNLTVLGPLMCLEMESAP